MKNALKMACVTLLAIGGQVYSNPAELAVIRGLGICGSQALAIIEHNGRKVCVQNFQNHNGTGKEFVIDARGNLALRTALGPEFGAGKTWVFPANHKKVIFEHIDAQKIPADDDYAGWAKRSLEFQNGNLLDPLEKHYAKLQADSPDMEQEEQTLEEYIKSLSFEDDNKQFNWEQFVKDNKEPLIAAGIVAAGGAGLYAGKKKLQKEAVEA